MSKCNQRIANQQKYIGNPVINHKVEQIVRAIVLGAYAGTECTFGSLAVYSQNNNLQSMYEPSSIINVGTDEGGYSFTPTTNSALIVLGYNPNAVLFRLNSTVVEGVAALASTPDGRLIAPLAAVVAVAYECSYYGTYKGVLRDYEQYKREYGGAPNHFKSRKYNPTNKGN